jgi:hypothetical protein
MVFRRRIACAADALLDESRLNDRSPEKQERLSPPEEDESRLNKRESDRVHQNIRFALDQAVR